MTSKQMTGNETQKKMTIAELINMPPGEIQREHAIEIAQQLDRYEQAVKLMKEQLRNYVRNNEPVHANGKVWDFSRSASKWVFEPENVRALATYITMEQADPWKFLSFDARALKAAGYSDNILSMYGKEKPGNESFRSIQAKNYNK